ncbi:MAG TPA: hypothetical protein VFG30_14785 [Polyangiales bacterium]|jgi:hypothetical protein|nr:hypothetical protein [Polyangiales bacterium]
MKLAKVLGLGAVLVGLTLVPVRASAEQRHDWMLAAGEPGSYLNLDVVFGAVQAAFEQRMNIFGGANSLTLRASALAAIPFGSTQLDADMRIVILNLGASVGAQDYWINQTFDARVEPTRKLRREREAGGDFDTQQFGFFEARAGLVLPFNDHFLFNNVNAFRVMGTDKNTFDYGTGVVHDGNYLKSDFQFFIKGESFGGVGPMVQLLNFPYLGERRTQLNYGLIYISRAGMVARNDLILFQVLVNAGDSLGGYDNSDVYGLAVLRGPISFTLAYRSVISL